MPKNLIRQVPISYKKTMYISEKPLEVDLDKYGEPIMEYGDPYELSGLHGVNYQPISAKSDIEMFGDNATGVHKALVTRKDYTYNLFTEKNVGDLVYLNGASPTTRPVWDRSGLDVEPKNGYWANYQINAIRDYHFSKHIYFVKYKSTGAM